MVNIDAEQLFRQSGAVLDGHFLLSSGLHSPVYWEKFKVLQYPEYTQQLCGMIAENFRGQGIELVAGPTTGGVILAFEVGRQLGVRGIFAEKEGSERVFKRGFTVKPGERILIVDDVVTTGSSVKQVVGAVRKLQGHVVGIGVLVDRSATPLDFGAQIFACLHSKTITYEPATCPLCAAGVPLVKPGSS